MAIGEQGNGIDLRQTLLMHNALPKGGAPFESSDCLMVSVTGGRTVKRPEQYLRTVNRIGA
jgi:hypothetical protein